MASNTYVALDKKTISSPVGSVTFTNISQAYTDLELVVSGTDSAYGALAIQVGNGSTDTGVHYSYNIMYGTGSTQAGLSGGANTSQMNIGLIDTTQSVSIYKFLSYSNTTTYKTILGRGNSQAHQTRAGVGVWRGTTGSSTQAINTITVLGTSLQVGTTLSLYGIKAWAAEATPKATGGYVYSDSTYWYHAFPFSSTFTPLQSLTADILVVAGGGGGPAGNNGGGGGAGGLAYYSSQSLSATGYTCTVGAGGAFGAAGNAVAYIGYKGNNSQFGALTAANGGGQGGRDDYSGAYYNGSPGGSGGGGGQNTQGGANSTGGSATPAGQGFAGGSGAANNGGGGGGAGGVGGNAIANTSAGAGGVGTSAYSSWGLATGIGENVSGTYYLAGGGGGCTGNAITNAAGGLGGGGRGGRAMTNGAGALSGMQNTGGGGGALGFGTGGTPDNTGAGGSGVIIVRYAK